MVEFNKLVLVCILIVFVFGFVHVDAAEKNQDSSDETKSSKNVQENKKHHYHRGWIHPKAQWRVGDALQRQPRKMVYR